MAKTLFTPPCGCVWHGARQTTVCAMWARDLAALQRLRADPNADPAELDRVRNAVYDHMEPAMAGEAS